MSKEKFRIEEDALGEVLVPKHMYYGPETQRAFDNFPVSGLRFSRPFIRALGVIKMSAAKANREMGILTEAQADAIITASTEVLQGKLDTHFVLDIFQTGSGTSTNMNANEVISNRSIEILGGVIGSKIPVHPNDHVNRGQSSNDVIPSAIHIAAVDLIIHNLLPSLEKLEKTLRVKTVEFRDILKIGRTHLQDATPVTLGQEFSGYARQVQLSRERIVRTLDDLSEVALGGTATGTGIGTTKKFTDLVISEINKVTGFSFREAEDHFAAQGGQDAIVSASASLRGLSVALTKIGNDIRWLASGPRCNIGEIKLPPVQPGSSIMPGKINPVMVESLLQVCTYVIGCDAAIASGGSSGNFELNVMLPLLCHNLLTSIEFLSSAVNNFTEKCVKNIEANREQCFSTIEQSLELSTALVPVLGHHEAARVAREAYTRGKTIREIMLERGTISEDKLKEILDIKKMARLIEK